MKRPLRIKGASNVPLYGTNEMSASLAENHVWISIMNMTDRNPPELWDNPYRRSLGQLALKIKDTDDQQAYGAISEEQARQIVAFVKKHESPDLIVVINCTAGVSRSAGVAAALTKLACKSDQYIFNAFTPNMLVYRTILNVGVEMLEDG